MDYAALKTELTTDPKSLGYATHYAAGNCNALAALINAVTGVGAETISLPTMDNQSFVTAFLPYLANVFTLAAAKQAFYTAVWNAILLMPTINFSSSNVTGLMGTAVADGILTSGQALALNQRTGSRAEKLFGAGTVVGINDIAQAMRS